MKRIILMAVLMGGLAPAWAQSLQCAELTGFVHSSYSGWQLGQTPSEFKPLSEVDACAATSVQDGGALCVKKSPSLESARQTASLWLKELSTCLNVKSASGPLKKVTVAGATHDIMEFEPLNYRGMPIKMNLRMQSDPAVPGALVTWFIAPQPGSKDTPKEINICPMVSELLQPQSLATDWLGWQGPILEKGDGFTQYVCAKVPHQAASRFDCDLRVAPDANVLSTRWLYPSAMTEQASAYATDIAQKISACEVGMHWKKGQSRHVVDVPNKHVRIEVLSNKNDVGRGPSVTMTVQHWKKP